VLAAEVVRDYGRTLRRVAPTERELAAGFRELVRGARRDLAREGVRAPRLEPTLDVRYAGQAYELRVPWRPGWPGAFHRLHARRFGHADPRRALEVVTLRLRARGGGTRLPRERLPRAASGRPRARRPVVFDGVTRGTAVYRRDDLRPGRRVPGPAIVCEYSATTAVPPGWRLRVDRVGGLLLEAT
jgi:N-methylhydantoinase A